MRLVILVGSSGSGKTYFANKLKERQPNWVVISSDDYKVVKHNKRHKFYNPIEHFEMIDSIILDALNDGKDVIYDACNLTHFRRNMLMSKVRKFGKDLSIIGVVFKTRYSTCVKQDLDITRGHYVGSEFILGMKLVASFSSPKLTEGFTLITTPASFVRLYGDRNEYKKK